MATGLVDARQPLGFGLQGRRRTFRREGCALLATIAMTLVLPGTASAGPQPSILITDARIVDGTGAPARRGSVRIESNKIVAMGELAPRDGEEVVDAGGQVLAPGFIDTHSHHDAGLFEQPDALPVVSQGVTTIVVGQDGESTLPLGQLFDRMNKHSVAINVASYVGHNSVRAAVLGKDFKRVATPAEIQRMRGLVRAAMREGAIGLSSGLEYDPGLYASKDEMIELAGEAARSGGRYISHIRSEERSVWAALDEIIEIGRVDRMPVQVSHMKLAMVDLWGQAGRYLDVLDRARAAGVDITGDVYPYEYWQTTLTVLFPKRDFSNRESAEFALAHIARPEGLLLSRFSPDPSLVGKTIAQVAKQRAVDPADALMQLIAESQVPGAEEMVIGTSMRSDDVARLIAWPNANISSDGSLDDLHPRGTGSFPRVLRQYVRERKMLTLEQAVYKMTGAAAAHMGISDRGTIRPGAYADLVLFDPDKVADRATSESPSAQSVGISRVWVNGALVFKDGKATGNHSGQPIKRPSTAH